MISTHIFSELDDILPEKVSIESASNNKLGLTKHIKDKTIALKQILMNMKPCNRQQHQNYRNYALKLFTSRSISSFTSSPGSSSSKSSSSASYVREVINYY